jgi:BetI-type transcriptional repressor, C-terminal
VLPLDDERREQNEVFFAFAARAQVDPGLHALLRTTDDELRAICACAVNTVGGGRGAIKAERLHALVDGPAFHTAARPDGMPPARLRRVLARHLDELGHRSS